MLKRTIFPGTSAAKLGDSNDSVDPKNEEDEEANVCNGWYRYHEGIKQSLE